MFEEIVKGLLQELIDKIDSGNCHISAEQQSKVIRVLADIVHPDTLMSKMQACDYLGVSRSTFDTYVRNGYIPKGEKQEGFHELHWNKIDLDAYLQQQN